MKKFSYSIAFFIAFILLCAQIFAQSSFTKYSQNPVLKRDTTLSNLPNDIYAIRDPMVIKIGNNYKMYYTCGGINYPTDTILRARICLCESTDGVNWIKNSNNPILDVSYGTSWDSLGVETATVIYDSLAPVNQRYKMWYSGQYFDSIRYDIGYAYSADGINWVKHPNPVLTVGNNISWEGGFIEGPSVIHELGIYKMWYAAYSLINGKVNIGYATSSDGINWQKHLSNPILSVSANAWDSIYVQDPEVKKINNLYYMWYGGADRYDNYGQQTGLATSVDGINWQKSIFNPVLSKGLHGSWDANTASFPAVILDNDTLKMWYTGKDVHPLPSNSFQYYWEIGYAFDYSLTALPLLKNSIDISLSPNPMREYTFVKSDFDLSGISIQLLNNHGKTILTFPSIKGKEFKISRNDIATGIYYLNFIEEGKLLSSKKLILINN